MSCLTACLNQGTIHVEKKVWLFVRGCAKTSRKPCRRIEKVATPGLMIYAHDSKSRGVLTVSIKNGLKFQWQDPRSVRIRLYNLPCQGKVTGHYCIFRRSVFQVNNTSSFFLFPLTAKAIGIKKSLLDSTSRGCVMMPSAEHYYSVLVLECSHRSQRLAASAPSCDYVPKFLIVLH
jgi:hypothetical protein